MCFLICLIAFASSTFTEGKLTTLSNCQNKVVEDGLNLQSAIDLLKTDYGLDANQIATIVSVAQQKLYLIRDYQIIKTYPVSTSKHGVSNLTGSGGTPTGVHRIAEKIGDGAKVGTIFLQGIYTRKVTEIFTDSTDLEKDDVTTRILWLKGEEQGVNKGNGVDSFQRRIYIHGTPEEGLIGTPASHGCVRMKNHDVIELFNLVNKGTLVLILP